MEKLKKLKTDCLIIGSGCAGFNAAHTLSAMGMKDILLATEGRRMGTSRNTGSDKQTYYKLAISSDCRDSVADMAQTYYDGMAMQGDLALVESANALKCFFKLEELGVPFPKNEYGEFVGYQTDHDQNKRATSAGPLTSKYMTEVLEKAAADKGVCVLDHVLICKLFVQNQKIAGALGVDLEKNTYILFQTPAVLLATGGSAYLYKDKVYPYAQSGMTGMAVEVGAKTANLTEWQYGLASIDFRWNVSGTYQQVLPRYISVDEDGTEREFLLEEMSEEEMLLRIFQKGYQWPFDSRKMDHSSKIDCLVHAQTLLGRKVYLDFTKNPAGFCWETLPLEAKIYLENSNAVEATPFKRLVAMNRKAVDLYAAHGIDLSKKKLRIAVCAQHQNGGIAIDKNYQTNIDGLYAIGEAAGVFGVYRPGGSALNSTQVSSMRAAQHVFAQQRTWEADERLLTQEAEQFLNQICFAQTYNRTLDEVCKDIQDRMSRFAGFLRNQQEIENLHATVSVFLKDFFQNIGAVQPKQLFRLLKCRDMLLTAREVLCAMRLWCDEIGARGGAVTLEKTKRQGEKQNWVVYTQENKAWLEKPLPIPKSETWFENVYNKI